MHHALLVLAQVEGEAEPSKVPFYIAGGLLAAWAVVIAFLGLSRPSFPAGAVPARGVMGITAVLVAAAMVTAVITA
jgi:hypothetical protein